MNTQNNKPINGNCWVAYCDILGFKDRIERFEEQAGVGCLNVFAENYYNKITDELQHQKAYYPNDVFSTWFSDSFMFFTRDDSKNAFGCLRGTFDIFCWMVISGGWPLRGALGFGQLYADISNRIFLGSGLINAYEYAEKQNWIGSVVTPESNNRLIELGIDLSQWKVAFTKYSVPFHQNEEGNYPSDLFTFKIHHNRPDVIKAVQQMQQEAKGNKKHSEKYENTLKFFMK